MDRFNAALEVVPMIEIPPGVWRTKSGQIPLFDHPTLISNMFHYEGRNTNRFEDTLRLINIGFIDEGAIFLSSLIMHFRCMSERQVRHLARDRFSKQNEIASRLRSLRKIGWFESLVIEDPETGAKETLWWLGLTAVQYFQFQGHGADLQDPWLLINNNKLVIAVCAVNQMRAWFEDRDLIEKASYCPQWPKGEKPRPFATFVVRTVHGPLTLYVERLTQAGKPVHYMQTKIAMYEDMIRESGELIREQGGSAMVVWSVGSFHAIEEIVGSIDHLPDSLLQAFVCDESMEDFPNAAFFFAQKIGRRGEVRLKPLQMDLF